MVRICYFDFQIASFHVRGVLTGVILLDVGPFIGTILLNRYLEKKSCFCMCWFERYTYCRFCDLSALMKCLSLVCRFSHPK